MTADKLSSQIGYDFLIKGLSKKTYNFQAHNIKYRLNVQYTGAGVEFVLYENKTVIPLQPNLELIFEETYDGEYVNSNLYLICKQVLSKVI